MERSLIVIIVHDFQPLTIITERSILDIAAALDPPLKVLNKLGKLFIEILPNSLYLNLCQKVFSFRLTVYKEAERAIFISFLYLLLVVC